MKEHFTTPSWSNFFRSAEQIEECIDSESGFFFHIYIFLFISFKHMLMWMQSSAVYANLIETTFVNGAAYRGAEVFHISGLLVCSTPILIFGPNLAANVAIEQ